MGTTSYHRREEKLAKASIVWSVFGALDAFTTSALYSCYLHPALTQLYMSTLKFVFYPIYALDGVIASTCAWLWVYLERNENGSLKTGKVVYAAVTTAAALFMVGAAVTGCVLQLALTTLAPFFFAANMALSSFYNLGASIYYWGKTAGAPDVPLLEGHDIDGVQRAKSKKEIYRDRAIGHALAGSIGLGVSIAALIVVVLAKPVFSPIGTVLGLIGLGLNLKGLYQSSRRAHALYKARKSGTSVVDDGIDDATIADTAGIFDALGSVPTVTTASTTTKNHTAIQADLPAAPNVYRAPLTRTHSANF